MIRLAALLLAVCASGLSDSMHVAVVVEARSPADYNRWVWQHSAECPDFPTVHITLDSWARRGQFDCPAISFWTDSGPLLSHRVLPDSQVAPSPIEQRAPTCDISHNMDQLAVPSGSNGFAMYDRFGRRLFTDHHKTGGLTSGRWIRFAFSPPGLALLDDGGNVLSTISSSRQDGLYCASDSVFALHADSVIVLLDRNGRALWRSRNFRSHSNVAVAPNGRAVAASTGDSLVICIPPSDQTVVLPHDREWARFGPPTMAWSADGNLLVVYQGSQTAWDSGRVFVVNTKGRLVRPSRKMQLYNIRGLLWMGDTVVIPAVNVDLTHVPFQFHTWASADSTLVSFLSPKGGLRRGVITAKFKLVGRWVASGGHLAYVADGHYLIADGGAAFRSPSHSGSPW